jgi:hypothetical protein
LIGERSEPLLEITTMALQLRNQFGQIDIASIDPAAVADLSDAAQVKLSALIDCVQSREAAQRRNSNAIAAKADAEKEQAEALQAHRDASDPFPFVPPDIERYGTKAEYDAACVEARQLHDNSVREVLGRRAHLAAIAAYIPAR